jgi:hypothetical protein
MFADSSAGVIGWVVSKVGMIFAYEDRVLDETAGVATFTQLREAGESLVQMGDVAENDRTHSRLKTNREVSPITVMNVTRQIHERGIVFAAFVTTEVIAWILHLLLNACPTLTDISGSVITDEDSAFIPAVEQVNRPFNQKESTNVAPTCFAPRWFTEWTSLD